MAAGETPEETALLASIGRFVVAFSWLVANMVSGVGMVGKMGVTSAASRAWDLALAGVTADQAQNLFFALWAEVGDLDSGEKAISRRVAGEVRELIVERNRLLHGSWFLWSTTGEEEPIVNPMVDYERLSSATGIVDKSLHGVRPERLDELAADAERLARLVWAFASGASSGANRGWRYPRVRDRLELVDGVVVQRDLTGWSPPAG